MKRTLSTVLAAILLTAFSAAAWAVTFPAADVNDGVPQVVQVPGDYATLSAASAGFNAMTGGVKRNWTIEITGNVNETAFVFFGNSFAFTTATLTFKPAPATNPVVTWNASIAAPAGWYGHLVIGASDGTANYATNTFPSNGNYIIDGSNTVGGTTRDLTFRVGTSAASAVSNVNRLIRIVGDNDAVVVKNANVEFYDNTGSSAAIGIAQGNWSSTNYVPDNVLIQNCFLTCGVGTAGTHTPNGFGIETAKGAGTVPAGTAPMGLTVEDCDIVVRQRGLFFNPIGSFNLYNNNITVGTTAFPTTGGSLANHIMLNSNNSVASAYTINIDGNVFTGTHAGGTAGAYGIQVATLGASNTAGITYNIRNNIIRDLVIGGAGVNTQYQGFRCPGATSIYNIEHNTIDMPEQAGVTATTADYTYAILLASHSGVGASVVKNNLIRYGELSTVGRIIRATNATAKTIQGNNLVPVGAVPAVGVVASTTYATFAAWQVAGYDTAATGGQSVDPASTTPAWDATRHFPGGGVPIGMNTTNITSTVTPDIDGNDRPLAGAVPGADEPVTNTAPLALSLSASDVNEHVPVNTTVAILSTLDPDAYQTRFTYSLVSGAGDDDNAMFFIYGNTLRVAISPDYETKSTLSIRLRTTDPGYPAGFFEEAKIITVNNNLVPTGIALDNNDTYEGSPQGTNIGTLSTTDPDPGSTYLYSLVSGAGDTDNGQFQITDDKLQIGAGMTPGVKSIRVRSTDSGSPSQYLEEIFTITVYEVRVDVSRAPAAGPYYADTNFTVDVVVGANDSPTTPHVSAFRVRFTSETLTLVGATASYSEFSTLAPDPGNAIFGQLGVTWGTVPPIVSAAPLSPAAVIPISTLGDLENNDKTAEVIRLEFKVNAWVTSPVLTEIVIEDDPNAGGAFLSHWKSSPFQIIEIPHTFNNMAAFEVGGTANSVSDWLFQQ